MNIAVIGLGYWGPNLLRNLHETQLCSKIFCCDLDEKKLARIKTRYPAVHVEKDYKKLLIRDDLNAVVIATPVSTHFDLALESLNARRHVFVEKPMTLSQKDAEILINLADKNQLVLMVGHTFEFSPSVVKIKNILAKGELGEIYYITSSRVNLGLHQKDVSVIWDLAPHDFSILFSWLNAEPVRISTMGKAYVQRNIPDVAFIDMEFPSGAIAHIQISWLAPSKLRRTTIIGSKKMLVYDDTENIEKVKIYDKGVDYKDPETFGEYQLSYRTGDVIIPYLETIEPLHVQMRHFIDCCVNHKVPLTDGYSGLRVVKALVAAEKSLRRNSAFVKIRG